MTESDQNNSNEIDGWEALSRLVVMLKNQVDVSQHQYRGEIWYVLRDASQRKNMRINDRANAIVALLDGDNSLSDVHRLLESEEVTHDEIIDLVLQLFAVNFLANGSTFVSHQNLYKSLCERFASQAQRKSFNPLAIRVPLFSPNKFLGRTLKYVEPFFSKPVLLLAAGLIVFACGQAAFHFGEVMASVNSNIIAPKNIFMMLVIYLFMKLVHELSHAYALRRWGGDVREIGVTFLILFPVPYVDASDAWFISSKKRRMFISAVGVLSELVLASVALLLWLSIGSGLLSDIAFNVMIIGSFSTVFFNANPLIKFDGYHFFQDLLEIPNLAARSDQYWKKILKALFCDIQSHGSENPEDKNLGFWLLVYAPLAFFYRVLLLVTITIFLSAQYFFIGILLACWAVALQILLPVVKLFKYLIADQAVSMHRTKVAIRVASGVTILALLMFVIPAPLNTDSQGVLWVASDSEVVTEVDGFVEEIYVRQGQHVNKGDLLMRFSDPVLASDIAVKTAQLKELKSKLRAKTFDERVALSKYRREIKSLQYQLNSLMNDFNSLTVTSPSAGIFYPSDPNFEQSQYFSRGSSLGYLHDQQNLVIRAVIPERDIGLVQNRLENIEFRLAESPNKIYQAEISYSALTSDNELPSAALGALGGGAIEVNPEQGGIIANNDYFVVELSAKSPLKNVIGLGGRAYIKFSHAAEPLALQWWRVGTQLVTGRLKT